jgi:hypothetical protein
LVVALGASSSVEPECDESDEDDEVDAALLLRFLFLFLCVGRGFVTAGGILSIVIPRLCPKDREGSVVQERPNSQPKRLQGVGKEVKRSQEPIF